MTHNACEIDCSCNSFYTHQIQVEHATGKVIVEFLKYAGYPELQWQRTARTINGSRQVELLAYSLHLYRSVSHKPVAAQICLLGLLSLCCTEPEVRKAIFATFSVTLLGDNFQYIDRLVEYINKIQGDYMKSAHAASFGAALDITPLIPALLHVRHVFETHELGDAEASEPVTTAMLVAARKLQNKLLSICGRDLTISTTHNECWHTGIPVDCSRGDYHIRRPPECIWKVARGAVAGKGRSRREQWRDFATRMVQEHFFPY